MLEASSGPSPTPPSLNWTAIYGPNNAAAQLLQDLPLSTYENLALAPLTEQLSGLQSQLQALQQQDQAWQQLQADAGAWAQSLATLADPATWSAAQASVSAPQVATAAADAGALPGTYTVQVLQLAQAEIDGTASTSAVIASPTAALNLAAGTLALTVGGATYSVAVTSTTTLASLAQALTGIGPFAAQVAQSPSGAYYLQLFASQPDQPIQYGGVLADWAAVGILTSTVSGYTVNVVQAAQGAVLQLGAAQYASGTNIFASVVPGLTIQAAGLGTTAITVSQDTQAMAQAVQGMAQAWNQWVQDTFQLAFATLPPTQSGGQLTFAPNPKQVLHSPIPVDTVDAVARQWAGFTAHGLGLADFGVTLGSAAPTLTVHPASLSAAIAASPAAAAAFFQALASAAQAWAADFGGPGGAPAAALQLDQQAESRIQQQEASLETLITGEQQTLQSQYNAWLAQLTQAAQTDQLLAGLQAAQGGSGGILG